MDGPIVESLPATEPADLSDLVRQLCRQVLDLRQEVNELRRENAELRQQAGYWKGMHARAVQRAERLEAEVEQLRGENRKLQDQLFGRKSEAAPSRDRSNRLEGEDAPLPTTPSKRGQRHDRPGPTRRDYSHLPVVEELRELPQQRRACPRCGAALVPSDSEDSEQIEIEVRAYRRRIRRRRYQRTCSCSNCPRTFAAAPAPKLIPKGVLGVSLWVEILLDKFASYQPTERLLARWRLLGLDVAAGTVAGGLERLEPLFQPLYDALLKRNAAAAFAQADETRWMVFVVQEGKAGYRWWLWVFLGEDTVAFRLDPTRSHDVPEGHFPAGADVVLMVDRYSAYKAMAQVKLGDVVLVFCWAHVRRDFVKVGKGWPEHEEWALAWLRRIRELYGHDRSRRSSGADGAGFTTADAEQRRTVATMRARADTELADPKLPTPRREVLTADQPSGTLVRPDPLPGRPANPAGQQCLRASRPRPGRGPQELLWLRGVMERAAGRDALLPVRHVGPGQDQHPHLADVVPSELCGEWWPSPVRHRSVPALEHVVGAATRDGARFRRQFLVAVHRCSPRCCGACRIDRHESQ